jgi:hypothetical protein
VQGRGIDLDQGCAERALYDHVLQHVHRNHMVVLRAQERPDAVLKRWSAMPNILFGANIAPRSQVPQLPLQISDREYT